MSEAKKDLKRIVSFKRKFEKDRFIQGIILKSSRELVLHRILRDFRWDGYEVLRRKDIIKTRSAKYERCIEKILKQQRLLGNSKEPKVNVTDWKAVFTSLRTSFDLVVVEGEGKSVNEFLIGRIEEVEDKTVDIRGLSPLAKWDKRNTIVPYKDITRIEFGDEYTTIFSKYMKSLSH